jgi:hypothetical protein
MALNLFSSDADSLQQNLKKRRRVTALFSTELTFKYSFACPLALSKQEG